jgi:release factor glutamine methyltransferase
VGEGVLIPRPETEVLVTEVIKALRSLAPKKGMEIGLGSGAISIELLNAFPDLVMYGSEVSPQAAQFAKRNADRILDSESHRLKLLSVQDPTDVFGEFTKSDEKFDFLVSNPPYLKSVDEIQDQVIEHEPHLALFPVSGDSLYFYRQIALKSRPFLVDKGLVFVEIPSDRAETIVDLFKTEDWLVSLIADLTGRNRVLVARRKDSLDG